MALQEKLNDLKGRPHDDKKAVASGVAIFVVIVLIVGWGFIFLRKVRTTALPSLENGTVPTDQFDFNLIRDTERNQAIYDPEQDIRDLREGAAENDAAFEASGGAGVGSYQPDSASSGGF